MLTASKEHCPPDGGRAPVVSGSINIALLTEGVTSRLGFYNMALLAEGEHRLKSVLPGGSLRRECPPGCKAARRAFEELSVISAVMRRFCGLSRHPPSKNSRSEPALAR
jgi:hypothetical protein